MVPEPSNPQTLNRFSYVNNDPIRYVDPTGHSGVEGGQACYGVGPIVGGQISAADCYAWGRDKWMLGLPVDDPKPGDGYSTERFLEGLVEFKGQWTENQKYWAYIGYSMVINTLGPRAKVLFGKLIFDGVQGEGAGGQAYPEESPMRIFLWLSDNRQDVIHVVIHEIGHLVDWIAGRCRFMSVGGCGTWDDSVWRKNVPGWSKQDHWVYTDDGSSNAPSEYATDVFYSQERQAWIGGPHEDFADTFTWYVYAMSSIPRIDPRANGLTPSDGRLKALNAALWVFESPGQ